MASTFRGLLGEKLGMTQVFDENNRLVPVTVVKAGPCVVTQVRTPEKDGYSAIQIGAGTARWLGALEARAPKVATQPAGRPAFDQAAPIPPVPLRR